MYNPPGANRTSLSSLYGNMLPPGTAAHGSSNPPGRFVKIVRLPHGGALVASVRHFNARKSYASPYEARTDIVPSPFTSHASPTRGEKCHHCLFAPDGTGN